MLVVGATTPSRVLARSMASMPAHARTYVIGHRRLIALGLMAAGIAVLALVVSFSTTVATLDATVGTLVRTDWTASVASMSVDASVLAGTQLVLPLTAAAVLALILLRHWHGALTLALSVVATQAVVQFVKATVARPRPEVNDHMTSAAGPSFPSAHSASAVALYLTLAVLVAHRTRGWTRAAALTVGATIVAAVGLSRIELGAHYPIDVLAGWLTGGLLVLAFWILVARLVARPAPLPAG